MLLLWRDQRSGQIGCMAGNVVLERISQIERERLVHVKGTIFATTKKIMVGRVCATTSYLPKDVAHFCNMSSSQTDAINDEKALSPFFLFITVTDRTVNYWMVPGDIVSKVVKTLKPKPGSDTCHLRIYQKDNKYSLGNSNVDITSYHQTLPMTDRASKRLRKAAAKVVASTQRKSKSESIPVEFELDGAHYEGTVTRKTDKNQLATC